RGLGVQPGDGSQQRALPRPAGAQQRDELAGREVQVGAGEDLPPGEAAPQPAHPHPGGGGHRATSPRRQPSVLRSIARTARSVVRPSSAYTTSTTNTTSVRRNSLASVTRKPIPAVVAVISATTRLSQPTPSDCRRPTRICGSAPGS